MMAKAYHALGFLMHQPPDVFGSLVEEHMGKLLQIVNSYQNPLNYLKAYQGSIRIHVGFSGLLLEQLLNKEVIDACRKIIDIPLMLNEYRESKNVEIIGLGYSSPLFSLIPVADWDFQIGRGKEMVREVFGQEPTGFYLAEAGFRPEIIPILKKNGYEYLVLDRPDPLNRFSEAVCSSAGNIVYHGIEIGMVAINRRLGGQGLIVDWLCIDELNHSRVNLGCEFWEEYFSSYLEQMYAGKPRVKSVFLREIMHDGQPLEPINIQKNNDDNFLSPACDCLGEDLNRAIEEVWQFSRQYHQLKSDLLRRADRSPQQKYLARLLDQAQRYLLCSQTGGYFSADEWGRLYDHIKPGLILLKEARQQI